MKSTHYTVGEIKVKESITSITNKRWWLTWFAYSTAMKNVLSVNGVIDPGNTSLQQQYTNTRNSNLMLLSLKLIITIYSVLFGRNKKHQIRWQQLFVIGPRMYINILLDTVLATDVNKYSLASTRCQPIWGTIWQTGSIFSCSKGPWDCLPTKSITTKHQSVFWLVSQSRRMSAIFVVSCRWISLVAANADPVDRTDIYTLEDQHCMTQEVIWLPFVPTGFDQQTFSAAGPDAWSSLLQQLTCIVMTFSC